MENESSVSKNEKTISMDVTRKSNLQNSIKQMNIELANFYKCILDAESFNYKNYETILFAKKVLNKYHNSVIQLNLDSLSTKKSIWIYANDFIDLSKYETDLDAYAITLSHVDFSIVLEEIKEKVHDDVLDFASNSFQLINNVMSNYVFYIEDAIVKNFNFDDTDNSLNVQLELIIDVQ